MEPNAIRNVSRLGLGLSDFAVLEILLHKGPLPVNVIGKKVLLTSGSITSAIDRLESRKLVRRSSDPKDRRSRIVALTRAGRHLSEKAFRQHAEDMEATSAILNRNDCCGLVRLLKKAAQYQLGR